jgi:secreted trypsin-like serine protease
MKKLLTIILAAVAAVLAPIGVEPASAIANGRDAPEGSYPFSVRLTMTGIPAADHSTRDSWCSGALIATRWVITAGHCFRDARDRRVSHTVARRTVATIGRTDLAGAGGHEVDVVAVHQSETADVALAELASPVTDIAPLRVTDLPPVAGETLRLTGYGQLGADSAAPVRLQTGQFVVDRVGDGVLEVSGRSPRPDTSACPHDSGGPYFREDPHGGPVLVGVVSTGPTCPHEGADLSARTDNLAGWIAGTINAPPGLLSRIPAWVWIVGAALAAFLAALILKAMLPSTTRGRREAAAEDRVLGDSGVSGVQ